MGREGRESVGGGRVWGERGERECVGRKSLGTEGRERVWGEEEFGERGEERKEDSCICAFWLVHIM